mgnify:FL=1
MFRLVIFDLDGTLLNTIGDLAAAGNHTLAEMGFPQHEEDKYRHFVGNGIPKLIERMLPAGHDKATEERAFAMFNEYYSRHKCDHTKPYPGMPELIRDIKAQGVVCGANSNKADEFSQVIVAHYFPGIFEVIRGNLPGTPVKPDPGVARGILEKLNARPEETLMVGDSDVDIRTGHNAGLKACGVTWGLRSRENLVNAGADFLADTPAELEKLLMN